MSYGRNFGMRSFENVIRDGRFKAPTSVAAGSTLRIGSPVSIAGQTGANIGFFRLATAAEAPGAYAGVAVYEHIQNKSDALTLSYDTPYDLVPLGQYAQMMHGPGTKVWFANTADKTLYDGRVRTGVYMVSNGVGGAAPTAPTGAGDLTTLGIGGGLVPDGVGAWRPADATETAWLIVEQVFVPNNAAPTVGRVEARFNF